VNETALELVALARAHGRPAGSARGADETIACAAAHCLSVMGRRSMWDDIRHMAHLAIMRAQRIYSDKATFAAGSIVEMVIWRLPAPEPGRPHGLKYRLYYGREGVRIVGYDNERGKGDHKHVDGVETAYRFVNVEQLIADFLGDVRRQRGES
jgi:Family of unknown function (DUF6516)